MIVSNNGTQVEEAPEFSSCMRVASAFIAHLRCSCILILQQMLHSSSVNLQTYYAANFINVKTLLHVEVVVPAIFVPCCQLFDEPVFKGVIDMLLLAPFYAKMFVRPFLFRT